MQRRRDYEGRGVHGEEEGGRKVEVIQKLIESGKCFKYLRVVTQVST
jgi:hypothetical protein